jgi:kynureninase
VTAPGGGAGDGLADARTAAEALDGRDPLSSFRGRFEIPDPQRIYLDGNSLGRLSSDVRRAIERAADDWATRAVEGWTDWIELPARVGDRLARSVLGARAGEVLIADSTTVNLYKLAHAAADLRPGPLVTDADNFPTDRYVLEGVARQRGRRYVEAESLNAAIEAAAAGVLCLSHVDYRTGALRPMAELTASTSSTDGLLVWDLSHSAGAVEIDLAATGAQLAVGCSYKYLNAGPGAPAYLYVHRDLVGELRSPIQGWFGRREQFSMGSGYEPADGIERFLAGTPPIAGIMAVDAAIGIVEEAGLARIAEKGRALTALAIERADAWLTVHGVEVRTPRQPAVRGHHVALAHPSAWQLARALIERADVVPDFRPPDILRLGFAPLTTSFVEAWDALDRLRRLLEDGAYRQVAAGTRRVT